METNELIVGLRTAATRMRRGIIHSASWGGEGREEEMPPLLSIDFRNFEYKISKYSESLPREVSEWKEDKKIRQTVGSSHRLDFFRNYKVDNSSKFGEHPV